MGLRSVLEARFLGGRGCFRWETHNADGTPCEQGGQTRQREQPVKDDAALACKNDVSQRTKRQAEDHRRQRPAGPVNVGKHLGSIALLGQSRQCSGSAVDARDANGHDGDKDDHVHDAVVAVEPSIQRSKHEWRRAVGVGVGSIEESVVGRGHQEANEGETEDVEAMSGQDDLLPG